MKSPSKNNSMKDITAIVATHQRPDALDELIKSFREHYSDLNFVVVDSSPHPKIRSDVKHIVVSSESGISKQRNEALKQVKTDLFLLLDDDYICREDTNLGNLKQPVIDGDYDIVGGAINNIGSENYNFHGKYYIKNRILYHYINHGDSLDSSKEKCLYDAIFNFFVADTNKIKSQGGRDNNLKYAREHDDFFLKASHSGLRIGYNNNSIVNHANYEKHHGGINAQHCINYFLTKRDLIEKIEIRPINKENQNYISFHHCIREPFLDAFNNIQSDLIRIYGDLPIKVSSNE